MKVNEIYFVPYTLQPLHALNQLTKGKISVREGALLKIQFDDGMYGFSDLFPWPELKDYDLKSQLRC